MSERPLSYVGISGAVGVRGQNRLEQMFEEVGLPDQDRRLLLGVKAVHKTQFLDIENKYGPRWYPVGAELKKAAKKSDGSFRVVQTYFDPKSLEDTKYKHRIMAKIMRRSTAWVDGVQYDMLPWHEDASLLDFVQAIKARYETDLLLQCHGPAMDELGPKGITRRLRPISEDLDYLLFDSSHGKGQKLDVERLRAFLDQVYSDNSFDTVGIAVAGGLDGDIVKETLPKLIEEFPDLSWDAEARLHSANGPLNMNSVRDYLQSSSDILS